MPEPLPVFVNSASIRTGPKAVLDDLARGFSLGPLWRAFAWDEIENRYRRSVLGLAWILVSYLIFVGSIALFFGSFNALDASNFVIYVAAGYAAFTFLIGNVTDGCAVFTTSATWIKSSSMPYSVYVYKSIARSLFPFGIQLVALFVVMPFFGWRPTLSLFLILPALALYLVNAVSTQMIFGFLSARWRDVQHLMSALTRVLFFMTPIMWVFEERTGLVRVIAHLNPLTHFVEIFRAPLMGAPIAESSWLIAMGWTAVGWALALAAGSVMSRRLPFWI